MDNAHFAGTCYRAANWIRVGRTQGRGRQDRFRQASETVNLNPAVGNAGAAREAQFHCAAQLLRTSPNG